MPRTLLLPMSTFFTLPFVDGYRWSHKKNGGLAIEKAIKDGKEILIEGGNPVITNDNTPGQLHIEWPLTSFSDKLIMDVAEQQLKLTMRGNENINWFGTQRC